MIIHYVGDLHQPLHGTSEVDHSFPKGDFGGNLHKLPSDLDTGVGDLHAVWDSVIYELPGYETLPMDSDTWDFYTNLNLRLEKDHPIDPEKEKITSFADWANESLAMSEELVYPAFVEHVKPDDDYIEKARPALEERIVLAGWRLADLVISIYKPQMLTTVTEVTPADDETVFLQ